MKRMTHWCLTLLGCALMPVHAEFLDELRIQYSVGQAQGEVDAAIMNQRMANLGYQATATVRDLSRNSVAWHLDYRFNPYLALQAGFYDLGVVRTHITGVPQDIRDFLKSANAVHPRSAEGGRVGLQARYPFHEDWELQMAYQHSWQKSFYLSYTDTELEPLTKNSQDDSWSLGIGYQLHPQWQVTLEYSPQRVQGEQIKVWLLGINYRFWTQDPPN